MADQPVGTDQANFLGQDADEAGAGSGDEAGEDADGNTAGDGFQLADDVGDAQMRRQSR